MGQVEALLSFTAAVLWIWIQRCLFSAGISRLMVLFLSESLLSTVINGLSCILQVCKFLFCLPLFIYFLY